MKLEFNFNQSGVIPYRKKENNFEILLITSVKKKKWIIPKGYVEFNLSPFESAKKEAYEEAGVYGSNETIELGYYEANKPIGVCHVKVFAMEVIKVLEDYPEKEKRKRKWFKLEEAVTNVTIPEVKNMISKLKEKIN